MIKLSVHARRRCRQRGITHRKLCALLENADVHQSVGNNCCLVKVSRRAGKAIREFDGLARLCAIISESTGELVTILPVSGGRRGRRYRKG
jgi:hypothetical protein